MSHDILVDPIGFDFQFGLPCLMIVNEVIYLIDLLRLLDLAGDGNDIVLEILDH